MVKTETYFARNNKCFTNSTPMEVKGLMLHSVGCSQPSAAVFVRLYNDASLNKCPHAFIDANTGLTYQVLPWGIKGAHAGGSANNGYIGVEMCEPKSIEYTHASNFKVLDKSNAVKAATTTYNTAVRVFAGLCEDFELDPLEHGVIISHSEGNKMGVASNHADPEHLWKQLGLNYTMDTFRADVAKELIKRNNTRKIYRVQVGAFSDYARAKNYLDELEKLGLKGFVVEDK